MAKSPMRIQPSFASFVVASEETCWQHGAEQPLEIEDHKIVSENCIVSTSESTHPGGELTFVICESLLPPDHARISHAIDEGTDWTSHENHTAFHA
jgi:hypothetical protein